MLVAELSLRGAACVQEFKVCRNRLSGIYSLLGIRLGVDRESIVARLLSRVDTGASTKDSGAGGMFSLLEPSSISNVDVRTRFGLGVESGVKIDIEDLTDDIEDERDSVVAPRLPRIDVED